MENPVQIRVIDQRDSYNFAEVRRMGAVNGTKELFGYSLTFQVELTVLPPPPAAYSRLLLTEVSGKLRVGAEKRQLAYTSPDFFGAPIAQQPGREWPSIMTVVVPLTPQHLATLESVRQQGDGAFHFDLRLRLRFDPTAPLRIDKSEVEVEPTGRGERYLIDRLSTPYITSVDLPHRIPTDDWLKVLSAMQYAELILVEVAAGDRGSEVRAAVSELQKAQEAFRRGQYRASVLACRGAMERLAAVGVQLGKRYDARGATPEERERLKRAMAVRDSVLQFSHPAGHSEDFGVDKAKKFGWFEHDQVDAQCAIHLVSALIHQFNNLAEPERMP